MEHPPLVLSPGLNCTLIQDAAGLAQLVDFFGRCGDLIGWDIETNVVRDFWTRKIRTIQFGTSTEQYVIDLLAFCPDLTVQGNYGKHLPDTLVPVLQAIEPVLTQRKIQKVGVNLSFEYMTMYWCLGMRTQYFWDCFLVERLIWAGLHSLKDYPFYSMDSMMGRYFRVSINKDLQTSFDLETPLTWDQVEYAALDTRVPLGIRTYQRGMTFGIDEYKNNNSVLCADNLRRVIALENDAIGAFQDMHLHGERIDRSAWEARLERKKLELTRHLANVLDPLFIPIPGIGSKHDALSAAQVDDLHAAWKKLDVLSEDEVVILKEKKGMKKANYDIYEFLVDRGNILEANRLALKAEAKKIHGEASKRLTQVKNLHADCEGDALINYGSVAQLLKVLNEHFPEVKTDEKPLEELDDNVLKRLIKIPVIAAIQKYRKLSKEINTYGVMWFTEWNQFAGDIGWLHPGDGRLHCTYNQLEAETGRTSSSQPNGQNLPKDPLLRRCFVADPPDDDEPDGYVIITADMAGAELRILAELANEHVWITAFNRNQDVHDVCIETMEPDKWYALPREEGCKYFALDEHGEMKREKCECKEHDMWRGWYKSINFGLPYGMGINAMANRIKKTVAETRGIIGQHQDAFPSVWHYLRQSGETSRVTMKSFDMFNRRRLFAVPGESDIEKKARLIKEEELRLPPEEAQANIDAFIVERLRKPSAIEKWPLTHRMPNDKELDSAKRAIYGGIERKGKNHVIQGTNASIAKVAMGAGFSPDGQPYLWHTLPLWKAKLVKFVHDELVVQAPKRFGHQVAALIGDAFKRAGAEVMSKVTMEFDYHVEAYWCK